MLIPILLIVGGAGIYLIGRANGLAERDQKASELLADERHMRVCAEQAHEDTRRELYRALLTNERIADQNQLLVMKLVRHGIEPECIRRLREYAANQDSAVAVVEVANG